MTITESLRQEFASRGVINIKNFLSPSKVAEALKFTRRQFEREGLWKDGKWRLDYDVSLEQPTASKSLIRSLKHQIFTDLIAEADPLIAELVNQQTTHPATTHPHPLITLPNALDWTVTSKSWHLDFPRLSTGGIPGVQIFTFLDTVVHGCAPTLAIAGSHRLLNDQGALRSRDVMQQLKQETYFKELTNPNTPNRERFLHEPGQIGDVEVQLIEMTGEPGDIYLMDLRVVHTASVNASSMPRIMFTQRFYLEAAQAELDSTGN